MPFDCCQRGLGSQQTQVETGVAQLYFIIIIIIIIIIYIYIISIEEVALHVRTGGNSGTCWRCGLGEHDHGRLVGDQLKK
jgi:hypothetical protein